MKKISWLTKRPIAHRGLHDMNKKVWENTLSAFRRAVDKNFAIECDVHLSSDRVPVVIHDGDLKRLTGTDGFVWQRTAAEMAALKVGGTKDHVPDPRRTARPRARQGAAGDRAEGHSRPRRRAGRGGRRRS